MTLKCMGNICKGSVAIENGMHTVVQLERNIWTGVITMAVQAKTPISAMSKATPTTIEEIVNSDYTIIGARGRRLRVYEDKIAIETKTNLDSLLTGNAFDGEKTIYFADVLGVQFKKASKLIAGFLQLETASASMNNLGSNFTNENSFNFDEDVNAEMEMVAQYVKARVDEIKKQKNAPVVMASPVSAADELKKFKELLDLGIITQEEFDAKKKQLLGL